ncbi:hypothetical protein [Streptomyces sp. SGAir0957]
MPHRHDLPGLKAATPMTAVRTRDEERAAPSIRAHGGTPARPARDVVRTHLTRTGAPIS